MLRHVQDLNVHILEHRAPLIKRVLQPCQALLTLKDTRFSILSQEATSALYIGQGATSGPVSYYSRFSYCLVLALLGHVLQYVSSLAYVVFRAQWAEFRLVRGPCRLCRCTLFGYLIQRYMGTV